MFKARIEFIDRMSAHMNVWTRGCLSLKHWIEYGIGDYFKAGLARRFTVIYDRGDWNRHDRGQPSSGEGSSLANTAGVRDAICAAAEDFFSGQRVLRIVDAPCGDMTWMPALLKMLAERFDRIEYVGIDIVPKLIEKNREIESPSANVALHFECLDVTRDEIPACDLFFCKDLINHLRNRDILRLISNLRRSQWKYAMITSNRGYSNRELRIRSPDASRHVDLQAPPFSLPPPALDNGYMAFWKLPLE